MQRQSAPVVPVTTSKRSRRSPHLTGWLVLALVCGGSGFVHLVTMLPTVQVNTVGAPAYYNPPGQMPVYHSVQAPAYPQPTRSQYPDYVRDDRNALPQQYHERADLPHDRGH